MESLGLGKELRRLWTDQAVLDAILHRRAAGLSLYATRREDNSLFVAAFNRFGSWHNALQVVGIDARVREQWNEEKVLMRIRQILHEIPIHRIRYVDSKLACAAERRFGSIRRAVEIALSDTAPRKSRLAK